MSYNASSVPIRSRLVVNPPNQWSNKIIVFVCCPELELKVASIPPLYCFMTLEDKNESNNEYSSPTYVLKCRIYDATDLNKNEVAPSGTQKEADSSYYLELIQNQKVEFIRQLNLPFTKKDVLDNKTHRVALLERPHCDYCDTVTVETAIEQLDLSTKVISGPKFGFTFSLEKPSVEVRSTTRSRAPGSTTSRNSQVTAVESIVGPFDAISMHHLSSIRAAADDVQSMHNGPFTRRNNFFGIQSNGVNKGYDSASVMRYHQRASRGGVMSQYGGVMSQYGGAEVLSSDGARQGYAESHLANFFEMRELEQMKLREQSAKAAASLTAKLKKAISGANVQDMSTNSSTENDQSFENSLDTIIDNAIQVIGTLKQKLLFSTQEKEILNQKIENLNSENSFLTRRLEDYKTEKNREISRLDSSLNVIADQMKDSASRLKQQDSEKAHLEALLKEANAKLNKMGSEADIKFKEALLRMENKHLKERETYALKEKNLKELLDQERQKLEELQKQYLKLRSVSTIPLNSGATAGSRKDNEPATPQSSSGQSSKATSFSTASNISSLRLNASAGTAQNNGSPVNISPPCLLVQPIIENPHNFMYSNSMTYTKPNSLFTAVRNNGASNQTGLQMGTQNAVNPVPKVDMQLGMRSNEGTRSFNNEGIAEANKWHSKGF